MSDERIWSMRSSLAVLATEHSTGAGQLQPIGFGIVTIVILLSLLIAVFAVKSAGTRFRKH